MKAKFFVFGLLSVFALAACSSVETQNEYPVVQSSENNGTVILLQHKTGGEVACCRDTAEVTAEECARALEKHCFTRVQDYPYRSAKYDFLETNTYPSRRWRDNEEAPRW